MSKMYHAEYYDASAADESDPDPAFTCEADNIDDVFTAIASHLGMATVETYLDWDNGYERYGINDAANSSRNVGVAIIGVW